MFMKVLLKVIKATDFIKCIKVGDDLNITLGKLYKVTTVSPTDSPIWSSPVVGIIGDDGWFTIHDMKYFEEQNDENI